MHEPPGPQGGLDWSRLQALVLGGSGLIGGHVVRELRTRGAAVRALVRSSEAEVAVEALGATPVRGDLVDLPSLARAVEGVDVVVHAAAPYPRSLFGGAALVERSRRDLDGLLELVRAATPSELLTLPRNLRAQIDVERAEGAGRIVRTQPERTESAVMGIRARELVAPALEDRLNSSLHPALADCVALSGIKRMVFVSSITTVGRPLGEDGDPRTLHPDERRAAREDDHSSPPADRSPYFRLKLEMEATVRRAANEGLPVVIVNPTFCVGDLDRGLTCGSLLLPLARGRMPFVLPGTFNAVAARGVARAIVAALERGRTGHRYILAGENLSLREFTRCAADVAGVAPPRWQIPIRLAEAGAYLSETWNLLARQRWPLLPLTGVQLMKHAQAVDGTRARTELGMPPTDLRVAIGEALHWYREQRLL